jgi:bacillithiol biosynthesis cysteine-adding enzyme BshC
LESTTSQIAGCLRQTSLPNTSRLFADYLYHFDCVSRFYHRNPSDPATFKSVAASLNYPPERRNALVAALRTLNGDTPALRKLAQPGTCAVVTGQQVGLFSGPCYTVYKALTAAKLAARLEESGIPCVTVFWLATEDHDFEEVNHAYTLTAESATVKHQVSAPANHEPVGGVAIADYPLDELAAALDGFPFADEVMAAVRESYKAGATMGQAFLDLAKRLFAGLDLLFLDPMDEAIRAIAAPLMGEAVRNAGAIVERIQERNAELAAAGYHAQVHVEAKTSLFFLLKDGRRLTLRRNGERYLYEGGSLTAEQLAGEAGHLSPNALLRPVMQDYLLPSVAQIGGPAEVAYLAQSEVIYDTLGRTAPVVLPRSGFTLLDARAAKLLGRYGLTLPDCFGRLDELQEKIAHRLVPGELTDKLAATQGMVNHSLESLVGALKAFDPTLASAAAKSERKILYQLEKIRKKTERQAFRQNERAADEAGYLYHLIYPETHLQERLYTILPFLAKHGFDLIGQLYDRLQLDCPDHMVVTL